MGAVMSALAVNENTRALLYSRFLNVTNISCIVVVNKPGEEGDQSAVSIPVNFADIEGVTTYSDTYL